MTARLDVDDGSATGAAVTVLVEFSVDGTLDETQNLALRVAGAIGETISGRVGFESAALMVSTDGRRMVNVAQWASEDAWRAATDDYDGRHAPADRAADRDWLSRRSDDEPVAKLLTEGGATLDRVAVFRQVVVVDRRSTSPAPPPTSTDAGRPVLHRDDAEAHAAVQHLVSRLQDGLDAADADVYDETFAADVLWGTPRGEVVDGVDVLLPIHRRLMAARTAPASRFELVSWRSPAPGVAVAQIRRRADEGAEFSEVAVYTLVRHGRRWWVSAAQNTPVLDEDAGARPNG